MRKVFVGLSGGVDSSVAALRLLQAGHDVTGVFIKTWHPDFLECTEEDDRLDAMRVAAHLKIPFLTLDAADVYRNEVAEYMIAEYREGRTPNPDVMCNKHVKFGVFLDFARSHDADFIATGHYARIMRESDKQGASDKTEYSLLRGADKSKDQSYFLWTLHQEQLAHILFPVGDSNKGQIRKEAKTSGLPTAEKRDSQGICFLGQVDIKEFLSHYVDIGKGDVLDEAGNVIGSHDGALYYTLGQRHGFEITEAETSRTPQYVVGKNVENNTLIVSPKPSRLVNETIRIESSNEIQPLKDVIECLAQFRYRQSPVRVRLEKNSVVLLEQTERPSPGQSCVFYDGDECLGGGIIS